MLDLDSDLKDIEIGCNCFFSRLKLTVQWLFFCLCEYNIFILFEYDDLDIPYIDGILKYTKKHFLSSILLKKVINNLSDWKVDRITPRNVGVFFF